MKDRDACRKAFEYFGPMCGGLDVSVNPKTNDYLCPDVKNAYSWFCLGWHKAKEKKPRGRPKGLFSGSKLDKDIDRIKEYLKKGCSIQSLARILDTSPQNLHSYLKRRNLKIEKVD